ncbi:MAG: hypothetical protein ACW98I_21300 [Candidatus Hodarchaeales archaeon]|jgi:uncharacterized membrane protein
MRIPKEYIFPLTVIGSIQFLILSIIAMFTYSGGTRLDPMSKGYSFFSNFFSDLGRTISYSGEVNTVSAVIFFITLIGLGLSFLGYFLLIPELFTHTPEGKKYGKLASLIGKCAVVAFIGIAFAPANLLPLVHDLLVISGFALVAFVSGIAFLLTSKDRRFSRKYTINFIVLFLVILCYGGLSLFIPTIITPTHLLIRATIQKIVVYTLIFSFLFQNYGAWNILKEKQNS